MGSQGERADELHAADAARLLLPRRRLFVAVRVLLNRLLPQALSRLFMRLLARLLFLSLSSLRWDTGAWSAAACSAAAAHAHLPILQGSPSRQATEIDRTLGAEQQLTRARS